MGCVPAGQKTRTCPYTGAYKESNYIFLESNPHTVIANKTETTLLIPFVPLGYAPGGVLIVVIESKLVIVILFFFVQSFFPHDSQLIFFPF